MKTEALNLLKKLITIPSYVNQEEGMNETQLVEYIELWSKENLACSIEKQPLGNDRFNLILKVGEPKTLFLAHTDTVAPSNQKQLQAIEKNGEIWGRGATDMKSGLAALLLAAKNNPQARNYWIVLYADEEYNFLGMKKFLETYPSLQPSRIISADGSDLQIGFACRGLIELRMRIQGKSGHAAKGNGVNAITATYKVLNTLEENLGSQSSSELGRTSMNLAYVLGGQQQESPVASQALLRVGQAGNVIPDICEFVVNIRPATPKVTVESVIQTMQAAAANLKVGCEVVQVVHEYSAWITPRIEVDNMLPPKISRTWESPKDTGYLDLQMMWQQYGQPTACMFGGGFGTTSHSSEERIAIENYEKTVEFFSTSMEKICK